MENYVGLIGGFLRSCRKYPENQALQLENQSYTFRELGTLVFKLAHFIQEREQSPQPLAAVFAPRSLAAYAGILAVLASGRGYVPLNPSYPWERTLRMLELSGVSTVIIGKEVLPLLELLLPEIGNPMLFLCPDGRDLDGLQQKYSLHHFAGTADLSHSIPTGLSPAWLPPVSPQDTAYLMFTSGSTGLPKGVPVSHQNVLPYIDYVAKRYAVQPQDRFSQMFELTFDLSVHDLFVCWEKGACLYPVPEEAKLAPGRFIREKELTMWFSVPSVAMFMQKFKLLKPGAFPSLRSSLFCGEALPARLADAWQQAAPNALLENLYGPTEATIAIAHYIWTGQRSLAECQNGVVPLGSIFPGQTGVIINEAGKVVEKGKQGELCLAGTQVAAGYLHDVAKTTEQFITLEAFPGRTFYRTGDLVQADDNDVLHYLGRIDDQVQILGHRVELLEIDHVLRQASGTEGALAVAWPFKDGKAEGIYGFIQGDAPKDVQKILTACREHLPAYMVPRKILFVSTFPLNASGKIDRRTLAAKLEKEDVPCCNPKTATE